MPRTTIEEQAIEFVQKRRVAIDLRNQRRATPCDNYDPKTGGQSCWAYSSYKQDWCPQCLAREDLHEAYRRARENRDAALRKLIRRVEARDAETEVE